MYGRGIQIKLGEEDAWKPMRGRKEEMSKIWKTERQHKSVYLRRLSSVSGTQT